MIDLLNIPNNCVIAFVSKDNKVAHIVSSHDTLVYLANAIKALRDNCFKSEHIQWLFNESQIEIIILEKDIKKEELKYRCNYYVVQYKEMGYNLVNTPKFTSSVKKEYDINNVRVCIVNSRCEKIVVGSFKSDEEANKFIENNYKLGIYRLVYK